MIQATRKIEFDAAHRVIGHDSKCKYLHGHRYVLELTFAAATLNDLGMVIDFGHIKNIAKEWIDTHLDHTTILDKRDGDLGKYIANYTKQKVYYMDQNPTAENIAMHLKNDIFPKLFTSYDLEITRIKLYETPNCYVEV